MQHQVFKIVGISLVIIRELVHARNYAEQATSLVITVTTFLRGKHDLTVFLFLYLRLLKIQKNKDDIYIIKRMILE